MGSFFSRQPAPPAPDRLNSPSFPFYSDPEQISIATFNVLADIYSSYQHYCPDEYLSFDYRKVLHSSFLTNFNTDFICLQEVDKYKEFFEPLLSSLGYSSHFFKRPSEWNPDGSLIAWKTEKWVPFEIKEISYDSHEMINKNSEYRKHNIGLLIAFTHKTLNKAIIIGNSHFYWDPKLEYVKFLQAEMFLENAAELYEKFRTGVLLVGDFNSTPDSNVVRYLTGKELVLSERNESDMEIKKLFVPQKMTLRSAFEKYCETGYPLFTNYTKGFKDCIDYVMYNEKLEVKFLGDIPGAKELEGVVGLPDKNFPSDHLPLLCSFSYGN